MTAAEQQLRAAVLAAKDAGLIALPRPAKPPGLPVKREPEPFVAPDALRAANARHDAEHGDPVAWERSRVRSSWLRGWTRRG